MSETTKQTEGGEARVPRPVPSPVKAPVQGDEALFPFSATLEGLAAAVEEQFPGALLRHVVHRGELALTIDRAHYIEVMTWLRDDPRWGFDLCSDVTAIDWLNAGAVPRFENVVHLYSLTHRHRVRVKVPLDEADLRIASITGLWPTANFHERETFDFYGIEYEGHPDLRRILMPDDWEGFPLRKDFPIGGAKSFYYKQSTEQYAGEPKGFIPRIRENTSDI